MILKFRQRYRRFDGMTLLEVVIAIAIAGFLSAGMAASAVYTMRQTAKNVEHIFAVQLASSEAACIKASRFNKLQADPGTLDVSDFEKRFAAPRQVTMDSTNPGSPVFLINYKLTGFGSGVEASGAGNSANWFLNIPDHSEAWTENQYKDHLLVITNGEGANQVMYVLSNEATNLNNGKRGTRARLTADLTGQTVEGWKTKNPGPSSGYAIDYGLYCEIAVSWGDGSGYKTVKEMVYVPNSR